MHKKTSVLRQDLPVFDRRNKTFCTLVLLLTFFFFNYFWLFWVVFAEHGLSLVAENRVPLRCSAWPSHCGGLSCCWAQALGVRASVVAACGLSSCARASVALGHAASSRTRGLTRVPSLAGGFLSAVPPGKSPCYCLWCPCLSRLGQGFVLSARLIISWNAFCLSGNHWLGLSHC